LLSGLLKTAFFAVCPQIFKTLANSGSEATSSEQAEGRALRYFWFFMLATAFTGTSLATVVIEGVIYSIDVGDQTQDLLRTVGSTVPTTVSAQWLNWIIIRIGITTPYNYLLQFNNFLYTALGWKCCARATAGG
jgi:Calcium-dependent channel, 7TM region, putative phosphate